MAEGRQSRKDQFEASEKAAVSDSKFTKEISKLEADSKGLFTLRCLKTKPDFTKEEVKAEFDVSGDLADIHFTDNFIFVRYKTKESALKVFEEKKDSFDLDVPGVSKTWTVKDKDDLAAKISKLSADTRGFYSIRIVKPDAEFSEHDVETTFGEYGDIADTHFTDKFIYVRYLSWKEAANAVKGLNDKFKLDIPGISATWRPQKSHTDRGPQIYIGNISSKTSKEQVAEILEPFGPREYKFYTVNNRNFAFAYFETVQDCKRVVSALNGKILWGSTLLVRQCRDRSRARYIADDDYQYRKADSRKGTQKASGRGGARMSELYISNFIRAVKQRDLEALFSSHGTLAYIEMIPTPPQECCKAYVGVYSAYEAKQMIHKLNQRKWNGLKLNVAYSTRVSKFPSSNGVGPRSGGPDDIHSNPVDRAHSLGNKLDIMLEDVLDDCEFCQQIRAVMSDLQQATREIKYQILRGEVNKGLGLIDELLNYVESQQSQEHMMRDQQIEAFYHGYNPVPHPRGFAEGHGNPGHFGQGRGAAGYSSGGQPQGRMAPHGRGRAQAWN